MDFNSILQLHFSCAYPGSEGNIADIFQTGLNDIHQNHYQQALASFNQVIERQGDLVASAYSNRCLVNLRATKLCCCKN